ncbi:hypothetical protein [Brasilonema sp. UFV-L1]|uniref:FitA-like ribbon-helix-helix domain-containing protein n=1 Tax=Brasilonema sp. UFV-L1 TaxID=2234130 RepID=UPI00145ED395|nr:hypothetical protein [Brasilonema sp. UFV-L1]NMG06866.1 hypothetical protein [Brasilonema sp. UFV-L1]
MAQVLVEDIDPIILEKIEILAKQHGRSLQEELKHILQQAAEHEAYHTGGDMAKATEAVARVQEMFVGRTFRDSAELIREDRER